MMRERYNAPILEHVLLPQENLALVFPTSDILSSGEVKMWFFRVISTSPINFVYGQEIGEITAQSVLKDENDNPIWGSITKNTFNSGIDEDDYLYIPDNRPFLIYHYAIGIKPADLQIYRSYNGKPRQVMFPNLLLQPGANYDYIDGYLSPYDDPRAIAEDIITNKIRIRYAFKNNSSEDVIPQLRFVGMAYTVVPIENEAMIKMMLAGKIPCRFEPVNGLTPFDFTKPDNWPEPVIADVSTFREVSR